MICGEICCPWINDGSAIGVLHPLDKKFTYISETTILVTPKDGPVSKGLGLRSLSHTGFIGLKSESWDEFNTKNFWKLW